VLQAGLLSCQATYHYNSQSVLSFCFCLAGCVSAKFYFSLRGQIFCFFKGWKKHTLLQALVCVRACAACKCVCFAMAIP